MKFGLNQNQWDEFVRIAIDPLKAQGCQLFVFGSRARGQHHVYSDLDVLIHCSRPLPTGLLFEIKDQLEQSSLPIKVDLVLKEHLSEAYLANIQNDLKAI